MRRVVLLAASMLLAGGCHFSQGWHWPRTLAATGSGSNMQTVVYWQNDAFRYQAPVIVWAANQYDTHPELAIKLVKRCLAKRNCVRWDTGQNGGGRTSISFDGSKHLVAATVILDDQVTNDIGGRRIAYHEACHSLGGGFGDEAQHRLCNYEHRAHNSADISAVYHNDPG